MDIRGKKALITGGALRIGNAITIKLVEAGADVVVHYNKSETDAYELCDLISNDGGTAIPLQKDLSRENAAAEIFDELENLGFIPEIIINNASIYSEAGILEAEGEAFHNNFDVNSLVPLMLSREMASRVSSGVVINLLDSRITEYDHIHVPYHLSKQTLFSFTRMLSMELAPAVRVNGVAPGAILPPPEFSPAETEKWIKLREKTNPLLKVGTPEEVAEAVEFLIRSDFITGQVIFVDGGRHLQGSFYGL